MKPNPLPPLEYLYEAIQPDFENGSLIWKCRPIHHFESPKSMNIWNKRFPGIECGSINSKNGYRQFKIYGKLHNVHRILFFMFHNIDLNGFVVDHIDGHKTNNKIDNLRIATYSENGCNTKLTTNQSTNHRNIYVNRYGGFYVLVMKNRQSYYGGTFQNLELAIQSRDALLNTHHQEFTNLTQKESC